MQSCAFGGSMASRFGLVATMLVGLLGAPFAGAAQADQEAMGIWLTQAGDAKVRVSRCGAGICGIVVWLKDPIDPATGKPQIDDKNPNPALAKRPMIGLALFKGMHPSGPNRWSARSTTPTTARRTAATFQCTGRLHCGSKAASDRCAAAKPGRAPNAERDRFNRGSPSRRWLPRRNPRELHR